MIRTAFTPLPAIGLCAALLVLCPAAYSADNAIIETRQAGFNTMGSAMKTLRKALKRDQLGTDDVVQAATELAAAVTDIADWFPAGTGTDSGADTDALPYIWKKPEKFKQYADDLIPAAKQLQAVAGTKDKAVFETALSAVKEQCSGCHKSFRAN